MNHLLTGYKILTSSLISEIIRTWQRSPIGGIDDGERRTITKKEIKALPEVLGMAKKLLVSEWNHMRLDDNLHYVNNQYVPTVHEVLYGKSPFFDKWFNMELMERTTRHVGKMVVAKSLNPLADDDMRNIFKNVFTSYLGHAPRPAAHLHEFHIVLARLSNQYGTEYDYGQHPYSDIIDEDGANKTNAKIICHDTVYHLADMSRKIYKHLNSQITAPPRMVRAYLLLANVFEEALREIRKVSPNIGVHDQLHLLQKLLVNEAYRVTEQFKITKMIFTNEVEDFKDSTEGGSEYIVSPAMYANTNHVENVCRTYGLDSATIHDEFRLATQRAATIWLKDHICPDITGIDEELRELFYRRISDN